MDRESVEILSALDKARTQWYHFLAIIVAGMGFFSDAYGLLSITCVTNLLGRIYYPDNVDEKDCPKKNCPGKLPTDINNAVIGVALVGTLIGNLVFGILGDKLGRKKIYGVLLIVMAQSAIGSALSFGNSPKAVMTTLCFFRFWLGFGIGGDYPISATIMAEWANQKTRGGFIAAVFAMQGIGIVTAAMVSMIVSASFKGAFPAHSDKVIDHVNNQVPQADYVWRIILMFGAAPALLTFYWRMKMPESPRFTALVEGDPKQAAADMAKILAGEWETEPGHAKTRHKYPLLSREFLRRHGRHLLGTATTWLLLDIVFYNNNLSQKEVYGRHGWLPDAASMDAIDEVFQISKMQFLVSLFAIIPGYWCTVLLVDRVGRLIIQLLGFLMMSAFLLALGIRYKDGSDKDALFLVLYALIFFFANFGPNTTTFVLSAELFPARMRSTCHGISAAAGKAGAIIGAFGIQHLTLAGNIGLTLKILAIAPALGILFTFLIPETKGRSLEEICGEHREMDEQSAITCNSTASMDA